MSRRKRAATISRCVAVVGIAVAALPSILAGSIGWSIGTVVAGIVVYYAGASTVIANIKPAPRTDD